MIPKSFYQVSEQIWTQFRVFRSNESYPKATTLVTIDQSVLFPI